VFNFYNRLAGIDLLLYAIVYYADLKSLYLVYFCIDMKTNLKRLPMNRHIYLSVIMFSLLNPVFSQDYYLRPVYSFSVQAFPNFYTTSEQKTIISADSVRYIDAFNNNSFSMGEGYSIGFSGGRYYNNKSEGVEASLTYFSGKKQKMTSKNRYELDPYTIYNYTAIVTEYHSMKSYNLSVSYFRQFYPRHVAPFFRLGAMVSFIDPSMDVDLYVMNNLFANSVGKTTYYYRYKPNAALVFGGFATAGLEFFTDNAISISLEAFLNVQTYKPKRMTCIKYTINDKDAIDELTQSEKEVQFVDSFTSTENENENSPYKTTRRNHALSSKGIQIGLKYRL
jgi:hypothetical protein